ncbi:YdcH family protein [Aestuariispira ectoiniformans]|uniref:YdcH family protein n=1 Tax=Aestuariispira ectoiniformans TaxID=2775080 RepID=UPI00223B9E89|nr:YdcH family protein [Aestuariispira ectoiniformans]
MSIHDRISSLKARHTELKKQVDQEMARPMPDDEVLRELKHEKLHLKDEIHHLELSAH